MMSRLCRYILFVLFLIIAIDQRFIASAEEAIANGLITRPVMVYKSGKLPDPFITSFPKEEAKEALPLSEGPEKPDFDFSKFNVNGIIWGVKTPQAIINNRVLTIGDLIDGAKVVSIEKKGVTLSFDGAMFDLAAPGRN